MSFQGSSCLRVKDGRKDLLYVYIQLEIRNVGQTLLLSIHWCLLNPGLIPPIISTAALLPCIILYLVYNFHKTFLDVR